MVFCAYSLNICCPTLGEVLSPVAQCVAPRAPICSNVYGDWFAPHARHSVGMTYRPIVALLYGCSGALEYPTTNSCRPINKSLSLILILIYFPKNLIKWPLLSKCIFLHIYPEPGCFTDDVHWNFPKLTIHGMDQRGQLGEVILYWSAS